MKLYQLKMNAKMRKGYTCSFLNTKSFTKSTVYGATAPRRTEPVTPSDDPQMNRVTGGTFLISARNWSISTSFEEYWAVLSWLHKVQAEVKRRFDHEVGHWRVIVSGRRFRPTPLHSHTYAPNNKNLTHQKKLVNICLEKFGSLCFFEVNIHVPFR